MYEQDKCHDEPAAIILVDSEDGDWEGVYIDDKLYYEGHSISSKIFIRLINEYRNFWGTSKMTVSRETMEILGGCFPDKFNELIKIVRGE